MKEKFYQHIQQLQDSITQEVSALDCKADFQEDLWEREGGGGGRTRIIEDGDVFEKGGVNISAVHGQLPVSLQQHLKVSEGNFYACGLSLVLHPKNPFVPTVHANWRYFEMYNQQGDVTSQWFGGGQDLTPYFLFEDDAVYFHQVCQNVCNLHGEELYPQYKKQCDEYFWNTHRNEARGIGGLFFDYLKANETYTLQERYDFVTAVGHSFVKAYLPIVSKRKDIPYTQEDVKWQQIRRGRYVEFNLIHDKGTLFGLKTGGRIESILMSLPAVVQWRYNHQPKENSPQQKLIDVLKNPKDWV